MARPGRHCSLPAGTATALQRSGHASRSCWRNRSGMQSPGFRTTTGCSVPRPNTRLWWGGIGDLDPATPKFPRQLEHLRANPLFRGIRYGNLWGRNLGAQLNNSRFIANLKRLPASGLILESANPNPVLIADILKLTDRVLELRIVIDHLPQPCHLQSP